MINFYFSMNSMLNNQKEPCISQFIYEHNAKNIVKKNTYFKTALSSSFIDLSTHQIILFELGKYNNNFKTKFKNGLK